MAPSEESSRPSSPGTGSPSGTDDAWRNRLFEAVVEGRLPARDRREIEHRFDTANRPARRDAVHAEIEVLTRFLDTGAAIRLEVSRSGRSIDIEVTLDDLVFAVHVKRLPSPASMQPPEGPPSALVESLSSIPRPYLVGVDWRDEIEPDAAVIDELRGFLLSARMGDKHVVRDSIGWVRGFVDVLSPRTGTADTDSPVTVQLVPRGDAAKFDRLVDRASRMLRRAYRQFAPALENVIVVAGGGPTAGEAVDRATLGGHVERWDRLPRVGQRVAHGRDDHGLWTGRHFERSRAVGWAPATGGPGKVWFREGSDPDPRIMDAVRRGMRIPD